MLAPQANNNRFGSKEKKLKATLKFSAAFKTKVSCTGASGAGRSSFAFGHRSTPRRLRR